MIYILIYILCGIIIGLMSKQIFELNTVDTIKAIFSWPIVLVAICIKLIRNKK